MISKITKAALARRANCSHVYETTIFGIERCIRDCGHASIPAIPRVPETHDLPLRGKGRQAKANLPQAWKALNKEKSK